MKYSNLIVFVLVLSTSIVSCKSKKVNEIAEAEPGLFKNFTKITEGWEEGVLNSAFVTSSSNSIHAIQFVNEKIGFITGLFEILKTEDGGSTWNLFHYDKFFIDKSFAYKDTLYFTSKREFKKIPISGGTPIVVNSDDLYGNFNKLLVVSYDTILLSGGIFDDSSYCRVFSSFDAGKNWGNSTFYNSKPGNIFKLFYDRSSNTLLGASEYHISTSQDFGKTWKTISTLENPTYDIFKNLKNYTNILKNIHIIDKSSWYELNDGVLIKKSNSGLTTDTINNNIYSLFYNRCPDFKIYPFIYYISSTQGYLIHEAKVFETKDEGKTWNLIYYDPIPFLTLDIITDNGKELIIGGRLNGSPYIIKKKI